MWLARRYPRVKMLCTDNAPYVDSVNKVALELGVENIEFRRYDLRSGRLGEFDLVYSMAVVYCVPDEFLPGYFHSLMANVSDGGAALVGTAANISVLQNLIGKLFPHRRERRAGWKQTGWMRNWSGLKKYIPDHFRIIDIRHCDHKGQIPSVIRHRIPWLTEGIAWFSKNVYPISNSTFLIEMKKSI